MGAQHRPLGTQHHNPCGPGRESCKRLTDYLKAREEGGLGLCMNAKGLGCIKVSNSLVGQLVFSSLCHTNNNQSDRLSVTRKCHEDVNER